MPLNLGVLLEFLLVFHSYFSLSSCLCCSHQQFVELWKMPILKLIAIVPIVFGWGIEWLFEKASL